MLLTFCRSSQYILFGDKFVVNNLECLLLTVSANLVPQIPLVLNVYYSYRTSKLVSILKL